MAASHLHNHHSSYCRLSCIVTHTIIVTHTMASGWFGHTVCDRRNRDGGNERSRRRAEDSNRVAGQQDYCRA